MSATDVENQPEKRSTRAQPRRLEQPLAGISLRQLGLFAFWLALFGLYAWLLVLAGIDSALTTIWPGLSGTSRVDRAGLREPRQSVVG